MLKFQMFYKARVGGDGKPKLGDSDINSQWAQTRRQRDQFHGDTGERVLRIVIGAYDHKWNTGKLESGIASF